MSKVHLFVLVLCIYVNLNFRLIAIGLEQFIPYMKTDSNHLNSKGEIILKHVTHFIQKYILICKDANRMYKHIITSKHRRQEANPIKFYFENGRAPFTCHYVVPLEVLGVAAPKNRKEDALPWLWKEYIYPKKPEINVSFL